MQPTVKEMLQIKGYSMRPRIKLLVSFYAVYRPVDYLKGTVNNSSV
ncbi:MAG: hypothetical protein HYZ15_00925 [Sphingobacteriales bacterium]|nr:hypothetical protein [Sphingobacteriales bacterium]